MLTIKVIRPDGSKIKPEDFLSNKDFSEFVEEVKSVFFNTGNQSVSGHPSVTYFVPGSDRCIDIYEGTIYVMNENGKTIAKYDLGYGNVWQQDDKIVSKTESVGEFLESHSINKK
jgi:hypothetical protein